MQFLLISLLLIMSVNVNSAVTKLSIITSEFDNDVMNFFIETNDQNEITSMRYITTMPNGGIFEDVSLPVQTVVDQGAVIVVRNGREALRLNVENLSIDNGGVIRLSYLFNGISNTWHVRRLKLKLTEGQFSLFDFDENKTNRLFIKQNWSRLFGVIGIKEIQSSFKP